MKRKSDTAGLPHCRALLESLPEAAGDDPALQLASVIVRTQLQAMELKRLYRQGWLKRGIPEDQAESVADHVFGTAMLALLLAGQPPYETVDRDKALRMALVHELGEVYAGDITPVDGVSVAEKYAREKASLLTVLGTLDSAAELQSLWQEFEDGHSAEACFVRQLDRLEMGLQAALYKNDGSTRMQEFFDSADRAVSDDFLRSILKLAQDGAPGI